LFGVSTITHASLINSTDIIGNWASGDSPMGEEANGTWVTNDSLIAANLNHVGSLVSKVSVNIDSSFNFSVNSRATDNDTFGLIWGFQDLANHYRLSWSIGFGESGVGAAPSSGQNGIYEGLKIIKEVAGISSVIYSSDLEYGQNQNYTLSISGNTNGFTVDINNLSTSASVFNHSVGDTSFTSGKVGIHELYQEDGNVWSNFALQGTEVPEPSKLVIFALGLIAIASRRFNKGSSK
jgi:hypothetical protein